MEVQHGRSSEPLLYIRSVSADVPGSQGSRVGTWLSLSRRIKSLFHEGFSPESWWRSFALNSGGAGGGPITSEVALFRLHFAALIRLLDLPIGTLHVGQNGDTGSDAVKCSDAFLLLPSWNIQTGRTSTSAPLYFPFSRMKFGPGSFSEQPRFRTSDPLSTAPLWHTSHFLKCPS